MVKNLIIFEVIFFILPFVVRDTYLFSYLFLTASCQFDGCGLGLATIWQLVTHSFLHNSIPHLLLNMYALWFFGNHCESYYGWRFFLVAYIFSVIVSGIAHVLFAVVVGINTSVIGSSGGVFGIIMLFGFTFPLLQLNLIIPPVSINAMTLVKILVVASVLMGVFGIFPSIAHFSHIGGMVGGYLCYRFRFKLLKLINQ